VTPTQCAENYIAYTRSLAAIRCARRMPDALQRQKSADKHT